ncbi:MAG: S9 family peptidase [Alphaproteobacteria bacterium]|nr:S9 family peptidase [Alphaproteobacteria bacterium]NCQ66279.1 S9 family peptidase [Alphaproteobacteria bacterium]NCT06627.1 S9 family peptidase [Alphaproteobacteria bacterium]
MKKFFLIIMVGLSFLSNPAAGSNQNLLSLSEKDAQVRKRFKNEISILETLKNPGLTEYLTVNTRPSLSLALREYQLFYLPQEKAWRITQVCDEFNVIERKDLWSRDNTPPSRLRIDDLGTLSFDGDFFVVFNPASGYLECHHIDSQELMWRKDLNIKSRKGSSFESIYPLAKNYIAYSTTSVVKNESKTGNTHSQSTYTRERLYILNLLNHEETTDLSDELFTHYSIAHIQRGGWNLFDETDENGNIYFFSSFPTPKAEDNFRHTPLSSQPTHVWSYNLKTNIKKKLYVLPQGFSELAFDTKGRLTFAVTRYNGNESFFEMDRELRAIPILSVTSDCRSTYKIQTIHTLPQSLILLDRRKHDKKRPVLYQWDQEFPTYKPLLSPEVEATLDSDIRFAITDFDNPEELLYYVTKMPKSRMHVVGEFDPLRFADFQKLADLEGGEMRISSISSGFRRALYRTKGPGVPQSLRVFDMNHGEENIKEIFSHTPDMPGYIKTKKLSTPIPVDIPYRKGKMPGLLTFPHNVERTDIPAFMYIHGGPHACDKFTFDPMVQFLTSRNIAVLQVNYPGSTGFGKRYENASDGNWDKIVKYIHDARNYLVELGFNPDKIAIGGTSFGAYVTVSSLQLYPNSYSCGVAVNGIYDLPLELKSNTPEACSLDISRQFTGKHTLGETHEEFMKRLSPALNEKRILPPLLLLHAQEDTTCPLAQATSLVDHHPEMRVMYGQFEGENHQLTPKHRHVEAGLTEWFLNKHLSTFTTPVGDLLKETTTFQWIKQIR